MQASNDLKSRLIKFNHRQLTDGEVFLLGFRLGMRIPMPLNVGSVENDFSGYHEDYKYKIASVIYFLNEYAHIPSTTETKLRDIVKTVWLWRLNIARGTVSNLFSGNDNSMLLDLTGVTRYIDMSDACGLSDIANVANYTSMLFNDLIQAKW